MKLVYVKFKESDNRIGVKAGQVLKMVDKAAQKWLSTQNCEKVPKSEYEDSMSLRQTGPKRKPTGKKAEAISTASVTKPEVVESSRALDKLDMEADPNLKKEGFKEGDLVMTNKEGDVTLDEKGKAILKSGESGND